MESRAPRRPIGRWRLRAGWAAWGCAVALLAAGVLAASGPLARQQGWLVDGGSSTIAPEIVERLQPEPERLGAGVAGTAAEPAYTSASASDVQQAMAANPPELSGDYSGAVADLAGGDLDYDLSATQPLIPASTLKIMTAVAVLDALGPQHTFATTVVSTQTGMIVLEGGGDPLLSSTPTSYASSSTIDLPSTQQLAQATADALKAQGVAQVTLGYDDSLFTGDTWHTDWPEDDREFIAPVTALVVDEGASSPGLDSPSSAAAEVFADQLRAAGIEVDGDPVPASAAGGEQLAQVASAPLSLLVQEMLTHSDNYIAEVLLRQVALAAGEAGSFDGGASALVASLEELGLWREGQVIVDGSGLSANDRLTTQALVSALQLAASRDDLADILAALPVGCATGTLVNRFTDDQSTAGRGIVRAKTGTLDQVASLAGYTPTSDGGLVAFAFIGNGIPSDQDARPWLDHVASALADCDCAA
ncbi:D-alanyl-D-alanine carboxypeptidase/D-alanyl-D-alanine-endopeptidase [Brooklawnia cerclae]|uniref:D-alanyl-D-alanine carboxypeptidase/D-alanyl-D-alanine-endopeptidase (Penicillin-binding protein 4) n=1 Tax=Brooklawnia cerclae TaxID=349934 RepID=A0ABX0SCA3_9ACTN|nr:D-alanyl-D-alanine carboxypeptidase/D-alanyl-D-alanine-endopeptidase (penicillin-binding protein 4) [Brooklawnia cerclae]